MKRRQTNARVHRSAAALLIVLGTLVLVLSATTVLVRGASMTRLHQQIDACSVMADDLLTAAEAPIVEWLTMQSATVVIDPDQSGPHVTVLHDQWRLDQGVGLECELLITAWDQLGMVPIEAARSGSPLRLGLPPEVLQAIDQLELTPGSIAGLDLFDHELTVFPQPPSSVAAAFGNEGATAQSEQSQLPQSSTSRLGELVATHNRDPLRVNVNTAPIELLDAAIRAASRGGIEQIIEQRRQGKPAGVGDVTSRSGDRQELAPQLVSSSNLWSFRIDIRVGPVRRSWWAIYTTSAQKKWEPLQRLAITH